MYWCWGTCIDVEKHERIYGVPIYLFSEFYRYGKNMGLSRLKTGSRKYGRDTPPPASRPIFIFFRKYGNGQDKYRKYGRDGTGFFPSVFILDSRDEAKRPNKIKHEERTQRNVELDEFYKIQLHRLHRWPSTGLSCRLRIHRCPTTGALDRARRGQVN